MKFPRDIAQQPEGHVVDISSWRSSDEFAIYPVGSKPKRMVFAPESASEPFILPGHSYLFKTASGFRSQQIWSEVIAYRIGARIGMPVPPAFIAEDARTGETGVLVEFFFGYPDEAEPARLVHAVDAIMSIFRQPAGDPHTVVSNAKVTRIMLGSQFGMDWWARTYTFDALIANTDRHTENWGFLVRRTPAGQTSYEIAPVYDNGTSLGFQISETRMTEMREPAHLQRFNDRGEHQCGWDEQSKDRLGHFVLCEKLLQTYPATKAAITPIMELTDDAIAEILVACTKCNTSVRFSPERAEFVGDLLSSRKSRLISLLERA